MIDADTFIAFHLQGTVVSTQINREPARAGGLAANRAVTKIERVRVSRLQAETYGPTMT
jgi:hypothetical protein